MGGGELALELRSRLGVLRPGQVLKLTARDPGAPADIPAWCRLTGQTLVGRHHPV
ncbi:MAG: sulfurtransferase TusA family protein [Candidatus Rokuibacteriota bacterium]